MYLYVLVYVCCVVSLQSKVWCAHCVKCVFVYIYIHLHSWSTNAVKQSLNFQTSQVKVCLLPQCMLGHPTQQTSPVWSSPNKPPPLKPLTSPLLSGLVCVLFRAPCSRPNMSIWRRDLSTTSGDGSSGLKRSAAADDFLCVSKTISHHKNVKKSMQEATNFQCDHWIFGPMITFLSSVFPEDVSKRWGSLSVSWQTSDWSPGNNQ